ncbi:MAG TPA: type II secretion system protein GspK [Verrucomicrobiae bacterium]|nr:type II secretion system protein GspK [Verrucomicrobiae bacterium]
MKLRYSHHERNGRATERASVLVIVLLIAFGLISIALYFANSMSLELRASDNRASGLAADQIIEGAARYVSSVLVSYATNGAVPEIIQYQAEAVPLGKAKAPEENGRFWLIGRDPTGSPLSEPYFSLIDETSKLDLNAPWLTPGILSSNLPRTTFELADAMIDWRDTNGTGVSLNYAQLGYLPKHAPFETVGELRLVDGATRDILVGEDINQNGVLDANENRNGLADPGLFDYFTVYSRQPNTHSDGTTLTNVNDQAGLRTLLEERLGASRAQTIIQSLSGGGGGPPAFASLLQFYGAASRNAGMTADEFALIYNDITVTNAPFTNGRVNINTAPVAVLACLPGMDFDSAQQLVNYRQSNPASLTSIAWIMDALGSGRAATLQALSEGDYITTHSYQFTADIAAVGPFGRGYRRVRFVFDISEGTPKVVYRQDLSRLGWALGRQTRDTWIAQDTR